MLNLTLEGKLGYLAGFFDGEGCFSIFRAKLAPHGQTCVKVSNTHYGVLLQIQAVLDEFGIRVNITLNSPATKTCKPTYLLKVSSADDVLSLCSMLRPYLIVKQEQADLLIRHVEVRYKVKLGINATAEEDEDAIYKRIKQLNRRGN